MTEYTSSKNVSTTDFINFYIYIYIYIYTYIYIHTHIYIYIYPSHTKCSNFSEARCNTYVIIENNVPTCPGYVGSRNIYIYIYIATESA